MMLTILLLMLLLLLNLLPKPLWITCTMMLWLT